MKLKNLICKIKDNNNSYMNSIKHCIGRRNHLLKRSIKLENMVKLLQRQ